MADWCVGVYVCVSVCMECMVCVVYECVFVRPYMLKLNNAIKKLLGWNVSNSVILRGLHSIQQSIFPILFHLVY